MARRAFARACCCAELCPEVRNDTALILSNPTAITVSKIINESVTTKAKPDFRKFLGVLKPAPKAREPFAECVMD